jgi:hypothetical protein
MSKNQFRQKADFIGESVFSCKIEQGEFPLFLVEKMRIMRTFVEKLNNHFLYVVKFY